MAKDLQFQAALREWLGGQPKYKNIREAASGIGIPFNTLRGYFSGKRPKGKNLQALINATGIEPTPASRLAKSESTNSAEVKSKGSNRRNTKYVTRLLDELQYDLARALASIPIVQSTLNDGLSKGKSLAPRRAQNIQSLMDALQRNLDAIVSDPEALQVIRRTVSGSDAGYLSGLLGALFDDRRLQTWRQMTTYKYGSK